MKIGKIDLGDTMIFTSNVLFQRLQDIREDLDLTQQELARVLKVSQTSYSRWETGKELIPLSKLNEFCNYTKHSMDYVTGLISVERKETITKKSLNKVEIGNNMKKIRKENHLFQYELARILNTTQSTICAYEQGKTLILTAFAFQLAKEFHLSLDEFCGRKEKEKIKN